MGVFAGSKLSVMALAAGLALLGVRADAGDLDLPTTGNLVGTVLDAQGAPELGASIQLFNKFDRLLARTTSDLNGSFVFPDLPADVYAVRVSASSYLPVSRDRIAVRRGTDSLLQVHLATLLSSVRVSYHTPVAGMSNDWKWVLRSSPATRPIVRYLPEETEPSTQSTGRTHPESGPRLFSQTHAMFSVSGGDASVIDSGSLYSDLGTGFALSTNVVGKHQLQLGGTYSEDSVGSSPATMSLTALYTTERGGSFGPTSPEVSLTISQFSILPGQSAGGAAAPAPPVRSVSMSVYQTLDPVEAVHFEYGMVGESVDFLQHTSRVSPFARATLSLGKVGEVVGSYSDGDRPDELLRHQPRHDAMADVERGDDLLPVSGATTSVPQFSYRDGQLELERTHNFELGYRKQHGSKVYAISTFRESVTNGRVHVTGDLSSLNAADLLSDGVSQTSIYNIGAYRRSGAIASVDQQLGDSVDVSVAYGRMQGFTANSSPDWSASSTAAALLNEKSHNIASINLSARLPKAGTRFAASYGWADRGAVLPPHVFTTQNTYVSPGVNLAFHQPLPSLFGMPGRLEMTADVRNMLAQGYLPINTQDSQRLLVVQAPRTLRGGLAFIF